MYLVEKTNCIDFIGILQDLVSVFVIKTDDYYSVEVWLLQFTILLNPVSSPQLHYDYSL